MKENTPPSPPSKHIVWVGKESPFSTRVCRWTLDWLNENRELGIDTIIRTSGFENALSSLEKPLKIGNPPELIVVDRSITATGIEHFSSMISDCIPECWVVELASPKDTFQKSSGVFYLQKGFKKADWIELLEHCFLECQSPQWSKAYYGESSSPKG